MSGIIEFELKGLKELDRQLRMLPDRVARKVVRSSTRVAAGIIKRDMQRRVPVRSGRLKKSITLKTKSRPGEAIAIVRPKLWYGHLVERGTAPHTIKAKPGKSLRLHGNRFVQRVEHPGMPARPFLRPAVDSNKEAYLKKLEERMWIGIARELAKL